MKKDTSIYTHGIVHDNENLPIHYAEPTPTSHGAIAQDSVITPPPNIACNSGSFHIRYTAEPDQVTCTTCKRNIAEPDYRSSPSPQPKGYNSVTTLAFTVFHNEADGSDITDASLLRDLLQRIADIAQYDGMVEATGGELKDTQENQ